MPGQGRARAGCLLANTMIRMENTSCKVLANLATVGEVPEDQRYALLDVGSVHEVTLGQLATSSCIVLFRQLLGVPLVNSRFAYYSDAFLFAISVQSRVI